MSVATRLSLILILLSVAAFARGQPAGDWCNVERWGSASEGRTWNRMYRETYGELCKADPATAKKSEKRARKLLGELVHAFVSGPKGSRFIGFTTYLLAVAEERAGRSDDAAWHWQMAQNFAPELRHADGDFPDVVPFLRDHLISAKRLEREAKLERGEKVSRSLPPGSPDIGPETKKKDVAPPVLVRKVQPDYPLGAREFQLQGGTVVEAVIDTEGIPREPVVKRGCGVTVLDFAAMDAVRKWRYKPASLEGRPIPVWLTVTVTFSLYR
jgi:TonB family protein